MKSEMHFIINLKILKVLFYNMNQNLDRIIEVAA